MHPQIGAKGLCRVRADMNGMFSRARRGKERRRLFPTRVKNLNAAEDQNLSQKLSSEASSSEDVGLLDECDELNEEKSDDHSDHLGDHDDDIGTRIGTGIGTGSTSRQPGKKRRKISSSVKKSQQLGEVPRFMSTDEVLRKLLTEARVSHLIMY